MRYQIFQYHLPTEGDLADLNAFLAGNRVVGIRQYLATQEGGGSLLVFVVETTNPNPSHNGSMPPNPSRVDYKEILSEEDFAIFGRLRELRKEVAQQEGVPIYAIFTNEQLAEMARRKVSTLAELGAIKGVGAGRVEKHGKAFLERIGREAIEGQ